MARPLTLCSSFSALCHNLDLNLEREPSLEIARVLLIGYQEAVV